MTAAQEAECLFELNDQHQLSTQVSAHMMDSHANILRISSEADRLPNKSQACVWLDQLNCV